MNNTTKISLGLTVVLLVVSLIFAVQNMTELKSARGAIADRDTYIERQGQEIQRLGGMLAHEQDMNQKLVARKPAAPAPAASALERRLAALESEMKNQDAEIEAQELEKNMLVERVQKQEIVRENELSDTQRKIRDAAAIGQVSHVQDELGFAVINAGKGAGLEPKMQFAVRRNVIIVGKVQVDSVEDDNSSIVNIVQGSVQPGQKIQKGDTLIAYPIY